MSLLETLANQSALLKKIMEKTSDTNIVPLEDSKNKQYSHFETISRIVLIKDNTDIALALAIDNLVNTYGDDTVRNALIDNLGGLND